MSALRHLASPIAKSFSEALRIDTEAGSWIFVAGQVGVAIPSDNKPISFELARPGSRVLDPHRILPYCVSGQQKQLS